MNQISDSGAEITRLLQQAGQGDRLASERLMPLIYGHLRHLASRQLNRQAPQTLLSPTALVHDTWLELLGVERDQAAWNDRLHFYRYASRAMRNILIDHVRKGMAEKRGGGMADLSIEDQSGLGLVEDHSLLVLNEALNRLCDIHPRLAEVVELRFFAGLSVEETASALSVTERTIIRDWRKARMLLKGMMHD